MQDFVTWRVDQLDPEFKVRLIGMPVHIQMCEIPAGADPTETVSSWDIQDFVDEHTGIIVGFNRTGTAADVTLTDGTGVNAYAYDTAEHWVYVTFDRELLYREQD